MPISNFIREQTRISIERANAAHPEIQPLILSPQFVDPPPNHAFYKENEYDLPDNVTAAKFCQVKSDGNRFFRYHTL